MKFPAMQAVKEDIEKGFNSKYQEHIKDTHIEAVYEAVERLWRKENEITVKNGGIKQRKVQRRAAV